MIGNIVAGAGRWVLEVPVAVILILVCHMGLAGAFWGTAVGYTGAAVGLLALVWRSDWEQVARDMVTQVCREVFTNHIPVNTSRRT